MMVMRSLIWIDVDVHKSLQHELCHDIILVCLRTTHCCRYKLALQAAGEVSEIGDKWA
jgi:hypothetical protein